MRKKLNKKGFTLIELMLAMAISASVLVIATIGFVAINRTFSRGTVRRQLSEGVQRMTEDVTRSVRRAPSASLATSCAPANNTDCPPDNNWAALCLAGSRYLWKNTSGSAGMYVDNKDCGDTVVDADTQELISDNFLVEAFEVTPLNIANLYSVRGVIRTLDDAAFRFPNDGNPFNITCRGSAENTAVRRCAIENFEFVVNAKGGDQ